MTICTLLRRKRSFLALFITAMLTFSSSVKAQTWNLAEPTDGSGATGTDVGRGICTDASGNVYIVGVFNGTGDFDLNSATTSTYTSAGNDGFVASYDKNGSFRWRTIISGTGSDFIAPAGGICTDGTSVWFTGNVNMSGAPQVISGSNTVTVTSTGGAAADVIVGKLACSNGAVNWAVEFGGAGSNDGGEGICVDPSGCCYVVGSYGGTFTLNGHTAATSGGSSDLFIAKFNPGGGMVRLATGGSTTGADMISGGAGICYVPGGTPAIVAGGSMAAGTGTYGSFNYTSTGGIDAMLLELDTTLNFTNAIGLGTGVASTDEILGVTYDPFSGGVYIAGYYNGGSITLPGTATMTNAGVQDIMVASYSVAANNFTWASHAGGTGDDRGQSITADGQGGILVSGNTGSIPCTFSGSVSVSSSSAGLNDLYVARYNTSGTPIWASVAGEATGDEQARGVASYVQSAPYVQNVFTTGNFQNSATFGVTTLIADGGSDYFLARINDLSTPLSATQSQVNLTCNGVCTGSATVVASGGTAPYTYSWSPSGGSGATASSLCATNYTVTITDAASTSITKTFNITQPPAITSSVVSQTNVACNGGTTGAATITASGGTGTLTYNWNPGNPTGDGTVSVTGLSALTWTCTVTDANSCTKTQTVTITQPPALVASPVSQTNVACNGGTNGSATVSASGGTPGYTYSWAPSGGTGATASGLAANTYTVTVTDANSCTATRTFTITAPPAITTTAVSQTNVSCFGGSNGAATISVSGGTPGYTYDWTPGTPTGDGTASVTGLTAQAWTCTVTDANGCTATRPFTITAPSAIATTAVSQTNVSCNGGTNGSATVSASGGTPGYTYSWAPSGGTAATASGLSANTYTVTVTDANGCTATRPFTITAPSAIVTTAVSQTNVSCNGGTNGSATVSASGGTPGYTYSWSPSGGTGATASGLAANTYTVTVTDANGCTATRPFTITAPSAIITTAVSQTNVSCNGGTNGSATVSASGGTPGYTYSWAPSGGTAATASGLAGNTYTVTVTDANGCTATRPFTITAPSAITATISSTTTACSSNTGTATVVASGGTPGYTYSWAPSGGTAATASGLGAGSYTCTITDANGCVITKTTSVTTPSGPTLTAAAQTNVSCNAGNNGAASVNAATGGTGPYTYNWTPGNPTGDGTVSVTGLTAGTWTCTVTDANGCTSLVTFTITAPSAIVTTAVSQTNVSCNGGTNGSATVSASGGTPGYTYSWAPSGGTAATASGLAANTYTVTVTDANGCTATRPFTITAPPAITTTAVSQTNVSCNGGTNGSATVSASGGTPGYTYSWAPSGGTAATASGLAANTYTVTVTDANGCTATRPFTITAPSAITSSIVSQTNVSCHGGTNGAATITASGGTGPYTYNWTPGNPTGDGTVSVTGLTAGVWTCTITDANGCTKTQTVTITEPTTLTATSTFTNVTCFGSCNGTATVTASGGTAPYTYSWTPSGGTGATASSLCAGTYTCTITDSHGCTATPTVTITQPLALSATATFTGVTCFGLCNGTATVTASGGTGPYTYSWSPSGGTAATASSLCAGTYVCTITDSHGCTTTQTVMITQPVALSATATFTSVTCFGLCNGTATVTASGGTGPYTYSWSPSGGTGATATGLCAGTYTCTITDSHGCTATQTVTIIQPVALSATATFTNVTCFGLCNGSVTVTVSGGTGPYTYSWSPSGGTGATATGLCAGTYVCTITDSHGCTTTQTVTIIQPAALSATATFTNVTCFGSCNGTASITASGGTAPYTYSWLPSGGTTATATGLCAGTYVCTITDANGCTTTQTITITEPAAITGSQTLTVCAGGSVTVGTSTYNTTGTFTDVLTAFNTCDSTVITNLTVLPANTTSQTLTVCAGGSVTVGTSTYNTTGTYTDVLTAFNTCDSTVTTNLTVLPANTTSQTLTVCAGGSVTVGTNTYNTSGTFTDVLTGFNTCDSTVTTILTVNAPIDVTTSVAGNVITANSSTGTYQWLDCNSAMAPIAGETNQSFTALSNGDFAVQVTDNGCVDTSACVNITGSGLSTSLSGETWNVYPNPTSGTFNLVITNTSFKELMISIVDIQGKEVYNYDDKNISANYSKQISLENLAKGIYYLKLNTGSQIVIKKLIIN